VRPFTATINLNDPDLAALAADGNLHIELTPNANVDDFGDVSEFVTVGLTYELAATPIVLSPVMPLISGSYRGHLEGEIDYAADVDTYTLDLEAGQALRFEALVDQGLAMIANVSDPNGGVLYTSGFAVPGASILPQAFTVPEDGTYTISVASGGSLGAYALNIFVNEAIEEESIGGATNNSLATAQSLDGLFRDLGGGMSRAVVRGSTTSYVAAGNPAADFLLTESFENGAIPSGWSVSSTGSGWVRFTNAYGASDGAFAMTMDSTFSNSYGNNEAVWTIDLPSDRQLTLSFDRITWSETSNTLPTTYTGSRNGDGVSISDDGVNWYTVQNAWYNASPVWEGTVIDLSAAAAAAGMTIGPGFKIKFQQYDNNPISSEGRGYDNIVISGGADHVFSSPLYDYYKFTLDADQVASIQLNDLDGDPAGYKLYDPAGNQITLNLVYSSDGVAGLYDFKAPSAGEYAIGITQGQGDYLLSIELDGSIENGANHTIGSAQRLDRTGEVFGTTLLSELSDYYSLPVVAGDVLTFETTTPDGGVSGLNSTDPILRLYDPGGGLVATDNNGAADGRNALITHAATQTGTYFVEVTMGPASVDGAYTLQASGYTGTANNLFGVINSSILDNTLITSKPAYIDLTLSGKVLPFDIDASALTLNGVPATSTQVLFDNAGVRYSLPQAAFVQGLNTISFAGGSISNYQGDLNVPYTIQFMMDSIAPTIIESSIVRDDVVLADELTFVLKFSEPVMPTIAAGFAAHARLDTATTETFVDYNESTYELTLSYAPQAEGRHYFALDEFIQDLNGLRLDGEPNPITTVPTGNGQQYGAFSFYFYVEDGQTQTLPDFEPVGTQAAFAYESTFTDMPGFVGDEQRFGVDLFAGQVISIGIDDQAYASKAEVELYDPSGTRIASSVGTPAAVDNIQIGENGRYTLLIRSTSVSLLPYTGYVRINLTNETEAVGGPSNDNIASAQDLGPAFFALGNGVEQTVVVGDNPVVASEIAESFESGVLGPAWTTSSSGTTQYSRIQVTTAAGAADGSRALVMDTSSSSSGFVLNEAVWTVDLSGLEDAVLSFAHAEWSDESHSLPTTFTGSYNGDGVAISDDGVTWRTILSAPNTSAGVWTPFSVNLLDVAQSAGMALGPNFKIKFQQYDDDPRSSDGRGYDDILITGLPVSPEMADYYRVDLEQGEWLSVTLAGQESVFGKPQVELFDAGGALLTVGSGNWIDASSVISDFKAPAAGDYYIRVPRGSGAYSLVVTRDATFSPEPTSSSTLLSIPSGNAVGAIDSGTDTDAFSFQANAGDNLAIWTETPGFDPLVAANTLDMFLELRGPDGYLQVEGGGGGDGLNALLNHTATQTGTYTIKVLSESQTTGGYVLNVTGQTGDLPVFEVVSSSLTDGATLNAKPTQLTVDLNAPVRINTVDAADLTVNGIAATAVTLVDADTLVFDLPVGLGEGMYQYHIAAGAISSLSGAPLEPFTLQVNIDTQGPYVVSTSLMPGDLLEPAKRTVVIRFNEALSEDVLNINDVQLRGPVDMVVKPIESFVYDPINYEVTLVFNAVDEGDYRLTLVSSTSAFRDLAGNPLDGEIPESPTPFEASGDGIPGGDFVIDFAVDRITPTPVGKPQRLTPFGSLLSASRYNSGNLYGPDDTDPFSVFMQPGQILTAVLSPTDPFSNTNLMLSASGVQAVSPEPGGPVVLTLPYSGPAQDFILTVSGDTPAYYNLEIYINAAAESWLALAVGETAADLGSAFVNLPGTDVSVANILGTGQPARELTVPDKLFAPNTMNFNFTDMTTPTGDGTLTITARGDLNAADEFITLNGEGLLITDLFVDDGGDNSIVTATLTIPQADLAAMAANGTISFTVTPSAMVGNYADTFVTLSLDYPGAPPVPVDEYALDLLAGQAVSVFIESDADLFAFELIDMSTGLSIAQGVDDSALFDQTLRDFIAPATGRYIVRAHVPAETDYRLNVIRGAASDFEPNDTPTDPLASLDEAGTALGFLQAPGAERLFALTRVGNISTVLELYPQTFSIINSFVPGAGQGLNISESDLAYDGQTLFITGSFPGASGGQVFALSPDTGEILSYFRPQIGLGYDIATYLGQVVTLSKSTNLSFLDPDTGAIIRELPIGIYADALAGAGPRGSIFVADTIGQTYSLIYEIDAVTGGVLNSFTSTTPFVTSLAFVGGHLYVTSPRTGGVEVYDPDTGVLVQVGSPVTTSYLILGGDGVVPGSIVPDIDRYTLTLQVGEKATLTSGTPFDHVEGIPLNSLDPAIRVFDPNGVEIAFDDNGASDGRNAVLTFTATVGGVYTIEVLSATGAGEYLLDIDRAALLPGDLDGDGFVGIDDLNIVLGNWNTSVPTGSLSDGDPSGDGFVGIDDLNTVLGNWNAGTPASAGASALFAEQSSGNQPAVEVATREQPASASRSAVEAEMTNGGEMRIADSRQRSNNARRSVSVPAPPPADASRNFGDYSSSDRLAAAAWSRDANRMDRSTSGIARTPWSLDDENPAGLLGLWEDAGL
jgi:hypothetical protein